MMRGRRPREWISVVGSQLDSIAKILISFFISLIIERRLLIIADAPVFLTLVKTVPERQQHTLLSLTLLFQLSEPSEPKS